MLLQNSDEMYFIGIKERTNYLHVISAQSSVHTVFGKYIVNLFLCLLPCILES